MTSTNLRERGQAKTTKISERKGQLQKKIDKTKHTNVEAKLGKANSVNRKLTRNTDTGDHILLLSSAPWEHWRRWVRWVKWNNWTGKKKQKDQSRSTQKQENDESSFPKSKQKNSRLPNLFDDTYCCSYPATRANSFFFFFEKQMV